MRLIEVLVPKGKREAIVSILEDEDIDYVLTEEASDRGPSAVISFPFPTPAVEPILARLREVRTEEDSYTIVVKAETVVSRQFEELEERYSHADPKSMTRIAHEELLSRAQDMSPAFRTFVLLTVISALVATIHGFGPRSPSRTSGRSSKRIAPMLILSDRTGRESVARSSSCGNGFSDSHLYVLLSDSMRHDTP